MSENQTVEVVRENRVDNNNPNKMNEQVETKTENVSMEKRKSQRKRSANNETVENEIKVRKIEVKPKTIEKDLKKNVMSLIHLDDDMLLETLRYLNWFDGINLIGSCKRLHYLNYSWADKKFQEFDLDKYLALPRKQNKNLNKIAPNIKILKTSVCNMKQTLMKKCKNVNSLLINQSYTESINRSSATRINAWIKKLKMESLSFQSCDNIDQLLNDVSTLKELQIIDFYQNTSIFPAFIEKNSNLERLSINIDENFNFGVFKNSQYLKCLHIRTFGKTIFGEIEKFGNLHGLTELSVSCYTIPPIYEEEKLQSFLKHLARTTKLNKLEVKLDCVINEEIFNALKSFSLNALSLQFDYYSTTNFTKFIRENPAPLKHLKISQFSCEELSILIEHCPTIESICVYPGDDRYNDNISDETDFWNILNISTSRPPLRLHVASAQQYEFSENIEIYINFVLQEFNVMVRELDFCCSATKAFGFSSVGGCKGY